ncbi:DUF4111 domain-containing protein [Saccharibacillus sp. CPCC 101409]|uniref:aminoglycoside adenylyltransferase domain-containing protein n=1 Tax=Saccharibacillus sp. CPCC 101409 TaxID=3058041 RepID=UPI002671510B|nr:aminoglycoside adenylyltransferase domain-containing protein [Saccharibacillus sp. CPCC 101409]MDO3411474.1 DUF4111 domain-containing protein [Saccharibacillus sp. CPCC 101409]
MDKPKPEPNPKSSPKPNPIPPDFLLYSARTKRGKGIRQAFAAAEELTERIVRALGDNTVGVYLHGSLALGGFNPAASDLDLLVAVKDKPARKQLRELTALTLELHSRLRSGRDIEYTVVEAAELRSPACPTPVVYHYSSMHRARYAGYPDYVCGDYEDYDLAAQLTAAYERGFALYGLPLRELYPPVPREAYVKSILHDVSEARTEIAGNSTYLILNLCRVLLFLQEGRLASKKEGGEWGVSALPEWEGAVRAALDAYTGAADSLLPVRASRLNDFAEDLLSRIGNARSGTDRHETAQEKREQS